MNQGGIDDGERISRFIEREEQIGPAQYDGLGTLFADEALCRIFEVGPLAFGRLSGDSQGDIVCGRGAQLFDRDRDLVHACETV